MPKRLAPTFHQGPLDHAAVAALNQLARDLYQSLYGAFGAAPPLQVSQDLGGVIYSVEPVALQQVLNNLTPPTSSITVNDLATPGGTVEVNLTGITTLQFTDPNDDDPFTVSSPVAATANVEFFPASQTQAGYITLTTQTLGLGTKTIAGNFTVDDSLLSPGSNTTILHINVSSGGIFNTQPSVQSGSTLVLGSQRSNINCISDIGTFGIGVNGNNPQFNIDNGNAGLADIVYSIKGKPGITGVITLAKVTPGGNNGSITIQGGIVIGFTAPT